MNVAENKLFLFRDLELISFTFKLRFLYDLKHKVHLSESVCGISHFRFRLVFVQGYIFVRQEAWTL